MSLVFAVGAQAQTVTDKKMVDQIWPHCGRGGIGQLAALLERPWASAALKLAACGIDHLIPTLSSGLVEGRRRIERTHASGINSAVSGNHGFDFYPDVTHSRLAADDDPGSRRRVRARRQAARRRGQKPGDRAWGCRIASFGLVDPDGVILSSLGPEICSVDRFAMAERMVAEPRLGGADRASP